MQETIKMPNGGYEVKVVRKKDILDCIDSNIVDKELMLAFIEQLEVDAISFLKQGKWTTLPYIGTLKRNEYKQIMKSEDTQELIKEAKETQDKTSYIMFRKGLRGEIARQQKQERIYRYITSKMVTKNKKLYNYLLRTKNEYFARFICYSLHKMDLHEV